MIHPEPDTVFHDYGMDRPDSGILFWDFDNVKVRDSEGLMVHHRVHPHSVIDVIMPDGEHLDLRAMTLKYPRGVWQIESKNAAFSLTEKGLWTVDSENGLGGTVKMRIEEKRNTTLENSTGSRSKRSGRDIQGRRLPGNWVWWEEMYSLRDPLPGDGSNGKSSVHNNGHTNKT